MQYMMYYQYIYLYNILSKKFRWVRLSSFSLISKPCTRFRRPWCRDILDGKKRCTWKMYRQLSRTDRQNSIVKSPGQNPDLMSRLTNACIRLLHQRWRSPTRPVKHTSAWLWQMRGRSCADVFHSFHWIEGSEERTAVVYKVRFGMVGTCLAGPYLAGPYLAGPYLAEPYLAGPHKVGTCKVGTCKVGTRKVGFCKVWTCKVGTCKVEVCEDRHRGHAWVINPPDKILRSKAIAARYRDICVWYLSATSLLWARESPPNNAFGHYGRVSVSKIMFVWIIKFRHSISK